MKTLPKRRGFVTIVTVSSTTTRSNSALIGVTTGIPAAGNQVPLTESMKSTR